MLIYSCPEKEATWPYPSCKITGSNCSATFEKKKSCTSATLNPKPAQLLFEIASSAHSSSSVVWDLGRTGQGDRESRQPISQPRSSDQEAKVNHMRKRSNSCCWNTLHNSLDRKSVSSKCPLQWIWAAQRVHRKGNVFALVVWVAPQIV